MHSAISLVAASGIDRILRTLRTGQYRRGEEKREEEREGGVRERELRQRRRYAVRKQMRLESGTIEDRREKVWKERVFPPCESVTATNLSRDSERPHKADTLCNKQICRRALNDTSRARANFSPRTYVGPIRVYYASDK